MAQTDLPMLPAPNAAAGEEKTATSSAHESTKVKDGVGNGILTWLGYSNCSDSKQWVSQGIYTFSGIRLRILYPCIGQ